MKLYPGILALSIISQCVYAQSDVSQFINSVARNIEYVQQNQDQVWTGFSLSDMPIVIDLYMGQNQENIYAFNLVRHALPWQRLKFGNTKVYFLPKNLIDEDLGLYDGQVFTVDSQLSFIFGDSASNLSVEQNFANFLVLEKAKYYLATQSQISKDNLQKLNTPYDGFYNLDNLKLIYLENAALTTYFQPGGQAKENALKDSAAIEKYRISLLSNDFQNFEKANDIYNGIPAYISLKASELSIKDYIFKAHQIGCEPLNAAASSASMIDCAMMGSASFKASAVGYAFSEKLASNGWQNSVETKFMTPLEILADYYQIDDHLAKSLTEKAMQNPLYNYARITAVVDDVMQPEIANLQKAMQGYQQQPGVELYMPWDIMYVTNFIDGLFTEMELHLIDSYDTIRVFIEDGDEIEQEGFYKVTFKDTPYALNQIRFNKLHKLNNDTSWSVWKLENQTLLAIDGQQMTVGEFTKLKTKRNFNTLTIDDKFIKIEVVKDGTLDASDGSLKLVINGVYGDYKDGMSEQDMQAFIAKNVLVRNSKMKHSELVGEILKQRSNHKIN